VWLDVDQHALPPSVGDYHTHRVKKLKMGGGSTMKARQFERWFARKFDLGWNILAT
jgi:hypothetical protein